ncbi:beta-N-acetylglucosaminidase [Bacteroidia bacterium]|nr:beta-N-acetylglucosaminidase [Bacteroidia bacterium]
MYLCGKKMNKKATYIILFASVIAHWALVAAQPTLYKQVDKVKMNLWVDSVFKRLTLDEKIGQLFILTVEPDFASRAAILGQITEQHIGGLLFSKGTVEEQARCVNQYQQESRVPLFICSDAEWGLSMRLANTPRFPVNMMLGAIQNVDLIRQYGEEMGRECREMGIHINFAPDLDVNNNPENPVIGTRSFGENQREVAERGLAYARGLEYQGIISVAKHFPGHGDTNADSHKHLPQINHFRARLDTVELYPFKQYINRGYSGVMVGHLAVPSLDYTPNLPASFSSKIIRQVLKKELGFEGFVITDALEMKGAGRTERACVEALVAGHDILLGRLNAAEEIAAIKEAVYDGTLSMQDLDDKCLKVLSYKYIAGLNHRKFINLVGLNERLNSFHAKWLIQKLNAEAITLLKNNNAAIPIKQLSKKKMAVVSFGETEQTEFQKAMALYGNFDYLQFSTKTSMQMVTAKLKNYDRIFAAVHTVKMDNLPVVISALVDVKKEVHLCFFVTPYALPKYKKSIHAAPSVVMAYENTPHAQKAAAEVIMGGLPAKGKLPVTIHGLYKLHDGLTTTKTRLSYQEPEDVGMSQEKLNKIAAVAQEGIDNRAFPGCQVLIAKNGVVVYNHSFGHFDYAKTHPVENANIYDLASVTKATATLAAVIKLFDEGKLGLNDKLSLYVPGIRYSNKKDITVREALFHQSGLPSFYRFYQQLIDSESFSGPLFSKTRDAEHPIRYDQDTYARMNYRFSPQFISPIPRLGISTPVANGLYVADNINTHFIRLIADSVTLRPDKKYLYSDLNFILLKDAVEHISGEPLDVYTEENFFANLGATTTGFLPLKRFDSSVIVPSENDEFLRKQLLIGSPSDEAAAFMGGVSGNAGLFSNANDLAKLLQLYLNLGIYGGEQYFSKQTTQLFTTMKSPTCRRGLGFDKPDKTLHRERKVTWNGKRKIVTTQLVESKTTSKAAPASAYGHTGFTGTCFWVDPDNQLIYIFLSNRTHPTRINNKISELNIRTRVQDIMYAALSKT